MTIKLQDMQEVTVNFAAADQTKDTVVTHNLVKDGAVNVTPMSVIAEIVSFAATGALAKYACVDPIARGVPTADKFTATVRLNAAPGGADTATVKVRFTSIYWPIFQGSDVAP